MICTSSELWRESRLCSSRSLGAKQEFGEREDSPSLCAYIRRLEKDRHIANSLCSSLNQCRCGNFFFKLTSCLQDRQSIGKKASAQGRAPIPHSGTSHMGMNLLLERLHMSQQIRRRNFCSMQGLVPQPRGSCPRLL